jgi:DNA-binding PadR family transcriptional regulator
VTRRFGHGELHLALLALLGLKPMHGYELMGELTARMGRSYRASPGSIYPAIQALEDEGLISGNEEDDRRVYELTKAGAKALSARVDRLAAIEARLGVRFASGIEASLGRFIECVRSAAERADTAAIEAVLDRAADELRAIGRRRR